MLVRFWGTRGSLPVALTSSAIKEKLVAALVRASGRTFATPEQARLFVDQELDFEVSQTFGGNRRASRSTRGAATTSSATSAAAPASSATMSWRPTARGTGNTFHIFMSHMHWDHIMGFPFFMPAYIPGNRIRIYGCHAELEKAFRRQNAAPSFPVDFSRMGASIEFVRLEPGRDYEIAGLTVRAKRQHHGGDSYGYRLEHGGKVVVYSTDAEHKQDDPDEIRGFAEFFRDADLVIFDAMYSLADAISVKEDWGHSSNVVGVELCQMARVKHLCLFHHEPIFDDARLAAILRGDAAIRGDHPRRPSGRDLGGVRRPGDRRLIVARSPVDPEPRADGRSGLIVRDRTAHRPRWSERGWFRALRGGRGRPFGLLDAGRAARPALRAGTAARCNR